MQLDKCSNIQPKIVELRGPSGRLYAKLNIETLVLECKRPGGELEQIDLVPILRGGGADGVAQRVD